MDRGYLVWLKDGLVYNHATSVFQVVPSSFTIHRLMLPSFVGLNATYPLILDLHLDTEQLSGSSTSRYLYERSRIRL